MMELAEDFSPGPLSPPALAALQNTLFSAIRPPGHALTLLYDTTGPLRLFSNRWELLDTPTGPVTPELLDKLRQQHGAATAVALTPHSLSNITSRACERLDLSLRPLDQLAWGCWSWEDPAKDGVLFSPPLTVSPLTALNHWRRFLGQCAWRRRSVVLAVANEGAWTLACRLDFSGQQVVAAAALEDTFLVQNPPQGQQPQQWASGLWKALQADGLPKPVTVLTLTPATLTGWLQQGPGWQAASLALKENRLGLHGSPWLNLGLKLSAMARSSPTILAIAKTATSA